MSRIDDEFPRRGSVEVTSRALAFAREFAESIGQLQGGSQIVTFDWAQSIIEHAPGQSDRELGPCLMLGAYRRGEIPVEARDFKNGFEFAIKVPGDVLGQYSHRLIDRDDLKPFRLALL